MRIPGSRHATVVLASLLVLVSLVGDALGAPTPADPADDVWLSATELTALPIDTPAWSHVRETADLRLRPRDADLAERNDHNTVTLAAALVGQRLGDDHYRDRAEDALRDVIATPPSDDDVLAAARRLVTYVVAADVLDLHRTDPPLDAEFRNWLMRIQRLRFSGGGGGGTIAEVHERRANNFGTSAGASRIAVAAYLGDRSELERAAAVFEGWLGDRDAYTGFRFGDLDWQADPTAPVGVNPEGATRDGHDIGGVLPEDQRRGGGFDWPPQKENYVWGALQGAVLQAQLLYRQGFPAWTWEDRALLRAVEWLHEEADFPAEGDDRWVPWLVNYAYGSRFPAETGGIGKSLAFTEWTHAPPDRGPAHVLHDAPAPSGGPLGDGPGSVPPGATAAPTVPPTLAAPGPDGAPVHLRTLVTGASRARTVTLDLPAASLAPAHVLSISTKPFAPTRAVLAPGGSWRRVAVQCGGRGQTGVEVWIGVGPLAAGPLAVTLDRAVHNVVSALSSFAGAHPTDPVAGSAAANVLGEGGRCGGGRDTDRPTLTVATDASPATLVTATAVRARRHEPGAPSVELVEHRQGSGGRAAGLTVTATPVARHGEQEVTGVTGRRVDWAAVGVVLRAPASRRPAGTGAEPQASAGPELAVALIALGGLTVAGRRTRWRRGPRPSPP